MILEASSPFVVMWYKDRNRYSVSETHTEVILCSTSTVISVNHNSRRLLSSQRRKVCRVVKECRRSRAVVFASALTRLLATALTRLLATALTRLPSWSERIVGEARTRLDGCCRWSIARRYHEMNVLRCLEQVELVHHSIVHRVW